MPSVFAEFYHKPLKQKEQMEYRIKKKRNVVPTTVSIQLYLWFISVAYYKDILFADKFLTKVVRNNFLLYRLPSSLVLMIHKVTHKFYILYKLYLSTHKIYESIPFWDQ